MTSTTSTTASSLKSVHIAWRVAAVTFVALLVSAGLRSAPGVMLVPLQLYFGWDRAVVSFSAAVGILLYGLVGPFAAALMVSIGIRRTLIGGLTLMALSTFASSWMSQSWQYVLTWGLLSGIGSGAVASVLAAAIVNRWFAARQGLVMGILSASTATGSLVFLPVIAWLARRGDWHPVVIAVSLSCFLMIPLVLWLVPERPEDVQSARYGELPGSPKPSAVKASATPWLAFEVLGRAARSPLFWLLFASFFVCGLTTNGLVGTHLIAFCGDHGIAAVGAAGLLSVMGFFDLIGTTASGWLTDRYPPQRLLFVYYGLRGLALLALPYLNFSPISLGAFAVLYGLDWIATVPPTVRLANIAFGPRDAPIVFGWVAVGHQAGAAVAAFGAGLIRSMSGTYLPAFVVAGAFAVMASVLVLKIRPTPQAAAPQLS